MEKILELDIHIRKNLEFSDETWTVIDYVLGQNLQKFTKATSTEWPRQQVPSIYCQFQGESSVIARIL